MAPWPVQMPQALASANARRRWQESRFKKQNPSRFCDVGPTRSALSQLLGEWYLLGVWVFGHVDLSGPWPPGVGAWDFCSSNW